MVGAAVPTLPTAASSRDPRTAPEGVTLGVLLPETTVIPDGSARWLSGFETYLRRNATQQGVRFTLQPATIDGGISSARRATEYLLDQGVDLLVGMVGTGTAVTLQHLLEAHNTALIVSNVGADVPRHDEQFPHLLPVSLSFWQANWAFGTWARRAFGARAFMATSFYDSGFDAQYAFRRGFEAAGGTVVDSVVTHVPAGPDSLDQVFARIDAATPDFVYASYAGDDAVEFVRAYADADLAARIPLSGSAFLVDESLLQRHGRSALNITTALPWASNVRTNAARHFVNVYQQQTGRPVDALALLGFDTAAIIVEAVSATDSVQSAHLREVLAGVELDSPRGRVRIQPEGFTLQSPIYVREVQRHGGALRNTTIATLDPVDETDDRVTDLHAGIRTGWSNPYLCA